MTRTDGDKNQEFLTVGEAASLLGVSRLRLREAVAKGVVPGRKDNEGRLRIDLTGVSADKVKNKLSKFKNDAAPEAILDVLFDEVEELQQDLSAGDARIDMLSTLVTRQGEALDQADQALEKSASDNARLQELLDRALTHLEDDQASTLRLQGLAGRALKMLDDTGDQLETSLAQNTRFESLLERALTLANQASGADGDKAEALAAAADRAMTLLDTALREAEDGKLDTQKADEMLGRAMAAGEQLERELGEREEIINRQKTVLDRVLAVSERAVGLVADGSGRRKSFFDWLNGK